ncbi:MAG: hypothetical protein ACKVOR_14620 [Flavobacteriales bacterium]
MNSNTELFDLQVDTCVVAFIDILGFADMLKDKSDSEIIDVYRGLKVALDESLTEAEETLNGILNGTQLFFKKFENKDIEMPKFEVRQFSDNVYFSCKYTDEQSYIVSLLMIGIGSAMYQFRMMQKGYFVRGAISQGQSIQDERVVFSQGLIAAYELESKIALYPRIVIDKKVINSFHQSDQEDNFTRVIQNCIAVDWAGIYFVDVFEILQGLFQLIAFAAKDKTKTIQKIAQHVYPSEPINIPDNVSEEEINDAPFEMIDEIMKIVEQRIIQYKDQQQVKEKYLWLREYMQFHGKDVTKGSIEFITLDQERNPEDYKTKK